jgi:hypothetical protein
MALEGLALTLCLIGWTAVVGSLLVATTGIADPTAIHRCPRCARWMLDTRHREAGACLRCRAHLSHPAAR